MTTGAVGLACSSGDTYCVSVVDSAFAAKIVRFPDASRARPQRFAAPVPVGVHGVIWVSARSVADDVGTSSAPVRIVSDASTPFAVQVLSPAPTPGRESKPPQPRHQPNATSDTRS